MSNLPPKTPNQSPPLATKRRWLRIAVALITVVFLVEFACFSYVSIREGQLFTRSDWDARRHQILDQFANGAPGEDSTDADAAVFRGELVVHPYLGYTRDPSQQPSINAYGFSGKTRPINYRSENTVIIGLVGGDVAEQFFHIGMPTLAERLKKDARYAGKEIIAVNLTNPGYKQPQQLMALVYSLAQGAQFDIVLNIDGFNEVALHQGENASQGVYASYPSNWYLMTSNIPDPSLRRLIGHREHLETRMVARARASLNSILRYSATWNMTWSLRQESLVEDYTDLTNKIKTYKTTANEQVPYWISGPRVHAANESDLYDRLASAWADCSLQLNGVCRENQIQYFHFLQPNPYAIDVAAEDPTRQFANSADNKLYIDGATKGYPRLIDAAQRLQEVDIPFVDLTNVFTDGENPISKGDPHQLQKARHEKIASEIARVILQGPLSDVEE